MGYVIERVYPAQRPRARHAGARRARGFCCAREWRRSAAPLQLAAGGQLVDNLRDVTAKHLSQLVAVDIATTGHFVDLLMADGILDCRRFTGLLGPVRTHESTSSRRPFSSNCLTTSGSFWAEPPPKICVKISERSVGEGMPCGPLCGPLCGPPCGARRCCCCGCGARCCGAGACCCAAPSSTCFKISLRISMTALRYEDVKRGLWRSRRYAKQNFEFYARGRPRPSNWSSQGEFEISPPARVESARQTAMSIPSANVVVDPSISAIVTIPPW